MNKFIPVITIDGPSGVGKSKICKIIANNLKWNILESGYLYRIAALIISKNKFVTSKNNLNLLFNCLKFYNEFKIVNFKNLDDKINLLNIINQENIGNLASRLACIPSVRNILLHYQRLYRTLPGLVTNGRDMGTVVFPDARIKFFLTADLRTRVYRRIIAFKKKGINYNFNKLLHIMKQRDYRDQNRQYSPLLPDNNSIIIDSTYLNTYQVVDLLMFYIYKCNIFN